MPGRVECGVLHTSYSHAEIVPRAIRLDICRDVTVEDNTLVRRDALVDPVTITPRADRATVRVRSNRYTR